jgi:thiosulfate reductase cytochrome b subunit
MNQTMTNIYLYTRYERFWHWLQMVMIAILLFTGFEVKGVYQVLGFQTAAKIHNITGLAWLGSFFFFIFWVLTTGEWKQYVPTTRMMVQVARYYALGIFKGEAHPVPKRKNAKHNPLQRLTYLMLAALLLPLQMGSGFLYWAYNSWEAWGLTFLNLKYLALFHLICAFAILQFVIIHVYMTTTGHSVFAHIKAMVTGWEEVEKGETVEEWEKATPRSER